MSNMNRYEEAYQRLKSKVEGLDDKQVDQPTIEDRLLHILSSSNEFFIEKIEQSENLSRINQKHLRDAVEIRDIFHPLEKLQPAYYDYQDLEEELDNIRTKARNDANYEVLAASYAPVLYLPDDEDGKVMHCCYEDLVVSNDNYYQITRSVFSDFFACCCITDYFVLNVTLKDLAKDCLAEPSVDNLWLYHFYWLLYDYIHIPMGHYKVDNFKSSFSIKHNKSLNCGYVPWLDMDRDTEPSLFYESDIPSKFNYLLKDKYNTKNLNYNDHITLINNYDNLYLLMLIFFGKKVYSIREGSTVTPEEFEIFEKCENEDELVIEIKQLLQRPYSGIYAEILTLSKHASEFKKLDTLDGFLSKLINYNLTNLHSLYSQNIKCVLDYVMISLTKIVFQ